MIDASTLETVSRKQNEIFVGRYEVAELTLHAKASIAFDVHADIVPTGRFVIVDGFDVAGGGIIAADNYPRRTHDVHTKSNNIYWSRGKVTVQQRELRNGHCGYVVWKNCSTSVAKLMSWMVIIFGTVWVQTWDFLRRIAPKTSGVLATSPNCLLTRE